jgi:proteasome lid subunit RPN8/RPN11
MGKIREIWLPKADLERLQDWVSENDPKEACALLLGKISSNIARVEEIILTPNTSESTIHYEIDPELLLKILIEAEVKNQLLVSIFHSHPASPYPSGIDIPYMQHYPRSVWLIMGLPKTEPMRGYQWYQNSIIEVKVKIIH